MSLCFFIKLQTPICALFLARIVVTFQIIFCHLFFFYILRPSAESISVPICEPSAQAGSDTGTQEKLLQSLVEEVRVLKDHLETVQRLVDELSSA